MNNITKKIIGKRIATAIADKNVTQKELAEHLNVKPNVISEFCKGGRVPNAEQIIKIADFFNISADYLLGRSEIKTIDPDMQAAIKYTGLSEEALKYWNNHNEAEKEETQESLRETNYEYTLNKLLQFGYFYDLLDDLHVLSWYTDDYRYVDSKAEALTKLGTDKFLSIKNTSDLLRYRVLKSIEKISDEFDGRENIGEHNGKQE